MERYDAAFRRLCVERGALAEAQLPFLLGRPLRDLPRDGAWPPAAGTGPPGP